MSGHSKIRNKLIANIFSQMGLGEAWGSGIGRILSAAREYGLPTPSVEVFDNMFRVNLFRKVQENGNKDDFGESFGVNGGEDFGDKSGMRRDGHKLTDTQRKVLDYIAEDKYISAREMADKIGVSGRTIENNLKNLKKLEILTCHGSPKNGY